MVTPRQSYMKSVHGVHFKKHDEIRRKDLEIGKNEKYDNEVLVIDKLFYRICFFCMMLGVNFYKVRKPYQRIISAIIVGINVIISTYFILYVGYISYRKPLNSDTLATTLAIVTWTLQATLSTIFLAYWQYIGASCEVIKEIYHAQNGAGIHHNRQYIVGIVRSFYVLLTFVVVYKTMLMFITWNQYKFGFVDPEIFHFRCDNTERGEEELHENLLKLMKVNNRLIKSVKRLDRMFNRYAFIMIATIIPTMTFGILMLVRKCEEDFVTRCIDLFFAVPLIGFFIFSFFAVTGAPAQLHENIHKTKSALCANSHVWYPYRPNVYLSATALVCHLEQTNLGVTIWGFSVISKPFVLTALSVMMTCLALFMQF